MKRNFKQNMYSCRIFWVSVYEMNLLQKHNTRLSKNLWRELRGWNRRLLKVNHHQVTLKINRHYWLRTYYRKFIRITTGREGSLLKVLAGLAILADLWFSNRKKLLIFRKTVKITLLNGEQGSVRNQGFQKKLTMTFN